MFLVERVDAELDERDCKFTNRVAKQNMLRVSRFPSQHSYMEFTVTYCLQEALKLAVIFVRSRHVHSKRGPVAAHTTAKPQKRHTTKKIEKAAYEMTFELYTRWPCLKEMEEVSSEKELPGTAEEKVEGQEEKEREGEVVNEATASGTAVKKAEESMTKDGEEESGSSSEDSEEEKEEGGRERETSQRMSSREEKMARLRELHRRRVSYHNTST